MAPRSIAASSSPAVDSQERPKLVFLPLAGTLAA